VSPETAAFYRCAYAAPVLLWLAWREDRRFCRRPWTERRLALPAGAIFAADLVCWHHAIGDVRAGHATALGNL